VDLNLGYKSFSQNFKNQFNTIDNFDFSRPMQIIGLSFGGHFDGDRVKDGGKVSKEGSMYFSYSYIIPKTVIINDTIQSKVTGFSIGEAYGWDIFKKNENVDVLFCLGFNLGRTRFYKNELVRQQNFFFAPKICLQPKIAIKKFTLSFTIEFDYDVTNPNWKKTYFAKGDQIKINSFRQTSLTTLFGLGYRI
jgi:hypothetical protein